MLITLFTIVVVALLFGLTIFVHELGHFLAARACGLVVDAFSIGFGPALWKRRIGGVMYKIGCLPLGGYVALPQLDPSGTALVQGSDSADTLKPFEAPAGAEQPRVLPPVAPWRRIVVSAAGAFGNVVLAVILAWTVYIVGKPATPAEESATVGFVDPASDAYRQGLRLGDEIRSANGETVNNWTDFLLVCSRFSVVTVEVSQAAGPLKLAVPSDDIFHNVDGRSLCMVLMTDAGMSADRAGLKPGDLIVELDGQPIISRPQLISLVAERKGQPVPITVKRNRDLVHTTVTPDFDASTGKVRIGIHFTMNEYDLNHIVHPRPSDQLHFHATAILRTLDALTTRGQAGAAAKQIGGPLAILISYYYIVKASLMVAVWFTGFLNVNLAILNMLPIPVLDGGHILFALWHLVFRRPAPARLVTVATNVFAALLITLIVFLTGRDFWLLTPAKRYWQQWTGTAPPVVTNTVPR